MKFLFAFQLLLFYREKPLFFFKFWLNCMLWLTCSVSWSEFWDETGKYEQKRKLFLSKKKKYIYRKKTPVSRWYFRFVCLYSMPCLIHYLLKRLNYIPGVFFLSCYIIKLENGVAICMMNVWQISFKFLSVEFEAHETWRYRKGYWTSSSIICLGFHCVILIIMNLYYDTCIYVGGIYCWKEIQYMNL